MKSIFGSVTSRGHAADLLNQQIWCWGRDIECAEGNLLMKFGLQRIEKPVESEAGSLYRFEISPTSRIILRGFGVFHGDDRLGGLFIRRYDFSPMLTPEPDLTRPAWSIDDLPSLISPSSDQITNCRRLLLTLIDWIREYEEWIAHHMGVNYRQDSLLKWSQKHTVVVPAEEMSAAWSLLGTAINADAKKFFDVRQTVIED